MEHCRQHYHYQESKSMSDLPVRDIVEEVLAITLEKHHVEILANFDQSSSEHGGSLEIYPCSVEIEHEDIVENEGVVKVNISGLISPFNSQQETFTLSLNLRMDEAGDAFLSRGYGKGMGNNVLRLHFARDTDHFHDSLFTAQLYHEEACGQQYEMGHGNGVLVFGGELNGMVN